MQRRQALLQLGVLGLGAALIPGCTQRIGNPGFIKMPLPQREWETFVQIAEAILPVDHTQYPTLESRADFVMTIINNCTHDDDVKEYALGFDQTYAFLKQYHDTNLMNLSPQDLESFFHQLQDEATNPSIRAFGQRTKELAVQHFTTCERFMTEEMNFQFVPGGYVGCAII